MGLFTKSNPLERTTESFEIMKLLMEIKGEISDKILKQSNATLNKIDGLEVSMCEISQNQTEIKTIQNTQEIRLTNVEERPRRYLKIAGVVISIFGVMFGIIYKLKGH